MNILFVHLLNNYTGSPNVLATILKELSLRKEFNISLLTSKTQGCLSNIQNIVYYNINYKLSNNKFILGIRFLISQIYTCIFVLIKSKKIDIIYINSIPPFAAAVAGRLVHKKIIYHVHEVYIRPNVLQKIMCFIMEKNANKIIAVSKYVSEHINRESVVIYNTVPREFERMTQETMEETNIENIINHKLFQKNILMVSSLKKYKGVDIFVSLARKCPAYSFILILSSSMNDIKGYFSHTNLPDNLKLLPQQNDLIQYYIDASIVLNLTVPDLCIEAFGMTLIEGFQFGTPCIAPDFGGPKEIILDGENGFLVNPCNEDVIIKSINIILESEEQYKKFVTNALIRKTIFSIDLQIKKIIDEIIFN